MMDQDPGRGIQSSAKTRCVDEIMNYDTRKTDGFVRAVVMDGALRAGSVARSSI